jgi:hypothetical protein
MEVESWLEWKTIRRRMPYYMPILLWLPKYNWRESLIYDLFAGVAVAAMIIPQVRSSLQQILRRTHARTHHTHTHTHRQCHLTPRHFLCRVSRCPFWLDWSPSSVSILLG